MRKFLKAAVTAACMVAVCALAQYATMVVGDARVVESRVITKQHCKLHTVMGLNTANTTVYIQIFESTTATNGQVPRFSVLVGTNSYYSLDFGAYGADMSAVTVAGSSTGLSNTLAGTNITIQAVISVN
jgi:hypothetical protein